MSFMSTREGMHLQIIRCGLYLYFLGLSFRNTTKAFYFLNIVKIIHVSIWNGIQNYKSKKLKEKDTHDMLLIKRR